MDLTFLKDAKNAKNILYIWGADQAANTEQNVNGIKAEISSASITVENLDRLVLSNHAKSTFDVVILASSTFVDIKILNKILELMKPSGRLAVYTSNMEKQSAELKLSGFINIKSPNGTVLLSEKPSYEIGSAVKLSFAKQVNNDKAKIEAIWTVDGNDDDIIDPDDLLDEEDKIKPDPASLKVCGTTGKRKACKNCSCGLADELLAAENKKNVDTSNAKSSCGNCYLGDAFRCSSCPYIGMPAFKPGEKVQLNDNLLKADV